MKNRLKIDFCDKCYNAAMRSSALLTAVIVAGLGCERHITMKSTRPELEVQPPLYRLVEQGKASPDATTEPSVRSPEKIRHGEGWRQNYEEGDFVLDHVPLELAFKKLEEQTRNGWSYVEIKVDWDELAKAGVTRAVPVSVKLWSPKMAKALSAILAQVSPPEAPLDFYSDVQSVVRVTTKARYLKDEGLTHQYSIKALMVDVIDDEEAEPHAPVDGQREIRPRPMTRRERLDAITNLIKETVDPDSWKQSDDCWIHAKGNILTVRQIPDNHRSLDALMGQLHETRGSNPLGYRVRPTTRPASTEPAR